MGNIGKQRTKLALITLGTAIAVGTPAIIIGSIYAYHENKTPIEQTNLVKFYEREEGSLFQRDNFRIYQPIPTSEGKFLVSNVTVNNISFLPVENLKNYSYNIEITEVIPNINDATLKFRYQISLITDPSIKITRESELYRGFFDNLENFKFFSK